MSRRRSLWRGAVVVLAATLAGLLSTSEAMAGTTVVSVAGANPWTDTGIALHVGDSVSISATGTIYIAGSDPGKSPDGAVGCIGPADGSIPPGPFLTPGLTCFSLVGRIDTGTPFEVGASNSFQVATAGELYLGVNDNFFGDNSGAWSASVTITSPPPAPAIVEQCKKGGWSTFTNPSFKNQGDCVSFVETGGRNVPSGS